ncbi:MAG: hypothetical protein KF690_04215 [Bacteroidetes bacterium]|nr:hypothetical protein [Bacteroidota bacterium]
MSLFQKIFLSNPDFAASEKPVLALLYDRLPRLDLPALLSRLDQWEPLDEPPRLTIEQDLDTGSMLFASVVFGAHTIHIGGLPSPLPQKAVERTIVQSAWSPDWKELAQSHLANVLLVYDGTSTDPIEQYIALYKVAGLLITEGLLAVVNEPAWTSHPAAVLEQILDARFFPVVRQNPPLVYWTGYIQAILGEERWFMTRGNHLFGIADFAWPVDEFTDPMDVLNMFHEVFYYFYFEKEDLQAGDVLNIDEENYYTFLALGDDRQALESEGKTFVIQKVHADEVERLMENPDVSEDPVYRG